MTVSEAVDHMSELGWLQHRHRSPVAEADSCGAKTVFSSGRSGDLWLKVSTSETDIAGRLGHRIVTRRPVAKSRLSFDGLGTGCGAAEAQFRKLENHLD